MPAIKKKWIKANQEVHEAESNENNDELAGGDVGDVAVKGPAKASSSSPAKQKKRSLDPLMLRGLDGEVLQEKRKRFIPPSETKLMEWLDGNLEKRNDVTLSLVQLYKYYTELCQGDGSDILDTPAFNRMIKNKFGKTFGIKESSVYKSVLKERNLNKKKSGGGIKLKEIAHEAINHFGNPWNGVRFFSLKQFVATKYPLLKIDQRPKTLKRILEMGVGYGQIELVKGIGMAGFYRLPGAEPPKPKAKQGKDEDKEDPKAEEGDSAGSADVDESNEKGDTAKKAEAEVKEEKPDKHKEAKPKKLEKCNLKRVPHGNPKKLEDTFPLAITFQSAPKTASIVKIRRYIQDYYHQIVGDNRWRKAVEGGAEKGHWEYISGSGITGRLHLLMDDFDPDSEHLQDMICAAIIACHEPKAASGNQIKKYISRYHPDFNVDTKPDRFKKALIRASERNMIVQVSGLGANGSFELRDVFIPSPRILSGEDASSGEEEDSDSSDDEPVYVPKGTKSRGTPQKQPLKRGQVVRKPPPAVKKAAPMKKSVKKESVAKGKGRPVPGGKAAAKKGGDKKLSPAKAKAAKKSKPSRVVHSDDDDEEEDEEEAEPEYTPRKSQSRGGPARTPSQKKGHTPKFSKSSAKSGRQQKKRAPSPSEDEDIDDEAQESSFRGKTAASPTKGLKTPKISESKSSKSATVSPAPRKIQRTPVKGGSSTITTLKISLPVTVSTDGADGDTESEYTPRKSSSRGGSKRDASHSSSKNKRQN